MKKLILGLLIGVILQTGAFCSTGIGDWVYGQKITAALLNAPYNSSQEISTAVTGIALTDNSADSFDINEGGTSYMKFITTNGAEKIQIGKTILATSDASASHTFTSVLNTGYCEGLFKNNRGKYGGVTTYGSAATNTNFGVSNADTCLVSSNTTGGMVVGSIANAPVKIGTNNAVRMTIDGSGTTYIHGGVSLEGTIRTNQNTTAPSTNNATTGSNYIGSNSTIWMAAPAKWITININGTDYKVPAY